MRCITLYILLKAYFPYKYSVFLKFVKVQYCMLKSGNMGAFMLSYWYEADRIQNNDR
jgi:hypothetical protein